MGIILELCLRLALGSCDTCGELVLLGERAERQRQGRNLFQCRCIVFHGISSQEGLRVQVDHRSSGVRTGVLRRLCRRQNALAARLTDSASLTAFVPVLSVWPMMRTFVTGFACSVWANLSSTGRNAGLSTVGVSRAHPNVTSCAPHAATPTTLKAHGWCPLCS